MKKKFWAKIFGQQDDEGNVSGEVTGEVEDVPQGTSEDDPEDPEETKSEIEARRDERRMAEMDFKSEAAENLSDIARRLQNSGFVMEAVRLERRVDSLERQMDLIRGSKSCRQNGSRTGG